ncbi:AsmA family protein, partial [Robiginitalea sp.]|uniref:AsmA family protein n=1 Tax=Robiginitalea sp. TaxID=1902411 RepID=UPI003C5FD48D
MAGKSGRKKWVLAGKIFGGILVFSAVFLIFFPILFHNYIAEKVTDITSDYLTTELRFKDTRATFFRHFPSLTLSMEDAEIMGSQPFSGEPLLKTESLVFSISLWRLLFTREVKIDEIDLENAVVSFKSDRFGRSNYAIFKDTGEDPDTSDSTAQTIVTLDRIRIEEADLSYIDRLRGIDISTRGFSYDGAGTFQNGKLELGSRFEIDSVDVTFQDVEYLKNKHLTANISSVYNDNAVSLQFEKNDLQINELELALTGSIDFDPDGYRYQVDIRTEGSHLKDIISLLPEQYVQWRDKAEVDGMVDANLHMSGLNNSRRDTLEESRIALELDFRDGKLKYRDAPVPVEEIFIDFKGSLDNGLIEIEADTLSFIIAED